MSATKDLNKQKKKIESLEREVKSLREKMATKHGLTDQNIAVKLSAKLKELANLNAQAFYRSKM